MKFFLVYWLEAAKAQAEAQAKELELQEMKAQKDDVTGMDVRKVVRVMPMPDGTISGEVVSVTQDGTVVGRYGAMSKYPDTANKAGYVDYYSKVLKIPKGTKQVHAALKEPFTKEWMEAWRRQEKRMRDTVALPVVKATARAEFVEHEESILVKFAYCWGWKSGNYVWWCPTVSTPFRTAIDIPFRCQSIDALPMQPHAGEVPAF